MIYLPLPLTVRCHKYQAYADIFDGANYLTAQVYGYQSNRDEAIAIARLFAAAPELLEACMALVEAWEKCPWLKKTDTALAMAKAAIAKVEAAQ